MLKPDDMPMAAEYLNRIRSLTQTWAHIDDQNALRLISPITQHQFFAELFEDDRNVIVGGILDGIATSISRYRIALETLGVDVSGIKVPGDDEPAAQESPASSVDG